MLGRTHMAIGAVGAVTIAPIIVQGGPWEPIRQMIHGHGASLPHSLIIEAMLVGAAVVGSVSPDLDQPDSIMAHKVERIGQIVILALLFALMLLLHWLGSYLAWAFVILFGILAGTRSNVTRVVGLGLLGSLILSLALQGTISFLGGILLVSWIAGAMFTKHRTFTHSGLGMTLFGVGTFMTLAPLHLHVAAVGLVVGYALHLLADAVSGGVPVFYPWAKRQGMRLIRTSSPWDHMVGGLALFAFLGLAVW